MSTAIKRLQNFNYSFFFDSFKIVRKAQMKLAIQKVFMLLKSLLNLNLKILDKNLILKESEKR